MNFHSTNSIEDYFIYPYPFFYHFDLDIFDVDNSNFLADLQDFDSNSENLISRQRELQSQNSSVRVEQPKINIFSERRKWQNIQGSNYLKEPRNRQAPVGVQYKNFLVCMKNYHFKLLNREIGLKYQKFVENNVFLRTLRNQKEHMSMKDYEEFCKIEEIQEILGKCFRTSYLFRELMLSKITPGNKKKFMKKIKLLENAFQTKELKKLTKRRRQRQEIQGIKFPQVMSEADSTSRR